MQYRPTSREMLHAAVEVVRKKRLRERYMGDLIWMAAKAQYERFRMMTFSEYDDMLEGKTNQIEKDNERIIRRVDEMLNMYG